MRDRELEHEASVVRCRLKIRLGELLLGLKRIGLLAHGGDRKSESRCEGRTLKDYGIGKHEAADCQRLAQLPKTTQDKLLANIALGSETINTAVRAIMQDESRQRRCNDANRRATMDPSAPEFCLIYADPAWDYGSAQFPNQPEAVPSNHYTTAEAPEIAAFLSEKESKSTRTRCYFCGQRFR